MARKSPAKIEASAQDAAKVAAEKARLDGKTDAEIAAAAKQAHDETVKAETAPEPADTPAAGDGIEPSAPADHQADDLLDQVISDPVSTRIAKDVRRALPEHERRLLAEACYVFGINPDPTLKPRELAAWRYDQGDPDAATPVPAYVSMVTSGGLKIRYPLDEDSEIRLRTVYNCFRVNRKTGEREVLPLPPDLTLPREAVDGIVRTSEHQYRTGYLREGGKAESDRRAKTLERLRGEGKIR